MTKALPQVTFKGKTYHCSPEKTLLTNLLEKNIALPYSCLEGVCFACMLQAVKGSPPTKSQMGLSQAQKENNFFLACQCHVEEDLEIKLPSTHAQQTFVTTLVQKKQLSNDIFLLSFQCPLGFEYQAGQFVNFIHPQTKALRSYSISSVENEGFLDFHIKLLPNGELSTLLCNQLNHGDEIAFTGPFGNCFYNSAKPNQPLILAGVGTGLAPLYGIVKDAIRFKHLANIYLFHGALDEQGLYFSQELAALALAHPRVTYVPSTLQNNNKGIIQGNIDEIIINTIGDCHGKRAYLCGDTATVKTMQKALFFAGIPKSEMFADAFIPASATKNQS